MKIFFFILLGFSIIPFALVGYGVYVDMKRERDYRKMMGKGRK